MVMQWWQRGICASGLMLVVGAVQAGGGPPVLYVGTGAGCQHASLFGAASAAPNGGEIRIAMPEVTLGASLLLSGRELRIVGGYASCSASLPTSTTVVRGTLPEMFPLFNFAPPERPVAQREESLVPAQSLFLMNNAWVLEQARHTATRLLSDTTLADDTQRLRRLYELAFFRAPTPAEQARALAYLKNGGPETAWTSLCQTIIASAEFRVVR